MHNYLPLLGIYVCSRSDENNNNNNRHAERFATCGYVSIDAWVLNLCFCIITHELR